MEITCPSPTLQPTKKLWKFRGLEAIGLWVLLLGEGCGFLFCFGFFPPPFFLNLTLVKGKAFWYVFPSSVYYHHWHSMEKQGRCNFISIYFQAFKSKYPASEIWAQKLPLCVHAFSDIYTSIALKSLLSLAKQIY